MDNIINLKKYTKEERAREVLESRGVLNSLLENTPAFSNQYHEDAKSCLREKRQRVLNDSDESSL